MKYILIFFTSFILLFVSSLSVNAGIPGFYCHDSDEAVLFLNKDLDDMPSTFDLGISLNIEDFLFTAGITHSFKFKGFRLYMPVDGVSGAELSAVKNEGLYTLNFGGILSIQEAQRLLKNLRLYGGLGFAQRFNSFTGESESNESGFYIKTDFIYYINSRLGVTGNICYEGLWREQKFHSRIPYSAGLIYILDYNSMF